MSSTLYIDLLKKSLTGRLYPESTSVPTPQQRATCEQLMREARARFPHASDDAHFDSVEQLFDFLSRLASQQRVYTMTEASGVDNVQQCVERVLADNIPGDFIETGVWKGGLPILMRGILKAHDVTDRRVYVADSFEGLPTPDGCDGVDDELMHFMTASVAHLAVSADDVRAAFSAYDLLDDQIVFLEGWFCDTLPRTPFTQLAVIRLDGDWYSSTRDSLEYLYPHLAVGGFIVIDDYGLPLGCRRAVDEYRQQHGIDEPMQWVNQQTVFWRREHVSRSSCLPTHTGRALTDVTQP